MGFQINTNVSSLFAHNKLLNNDSKLSKSLERLSSGLRINRAADDAAGMTIADTLKSQALGLGQASKNATDGISIVQTADSALEESINIINSIKTKSIQSAQDGQTTESRRAIQSDITKLMEELDMIAQTTSFNNQKLLSGAFSNKKFQVGAYSGETVNLSIGDAGSNNIGHVTSGAMSLNNEAAGMVKISLYSNIQNKNYAVEAVDVQYNNNAENSLGAVENAINKLSDVTGITAYSNVQSTTDGTIKAGKTDVDFTINGVLIGEVDVAINDSNGSLEAAINNKTSEHGITATVDEEGYLTLTSADKRAIEVTSASLTQGSGTGTDAVFGGSDLTTLGTITLNQQGSTEIQVTNMGGGSVVALTNGLEINGNVNTTVDSVISTDSVLEVGSMLAAGWTTGQTLAGDAFSADISTTQDSYLKEGTVLATSSIIAANSVLTGAATTTNVAFSTADTSILKAGSALDSGSTIAAGSVLGAATVITSTTNATAGTSTLKTGSILIADSIIAAGSVFGSDTLIASGLTTDLVTTADSTIKAGSILAIATVIAKDSVLGGNVTLTASGVTTGISTLKANSAIGSGSTLKIGTVLSSNDADVLNTGANFGGTIVDNVVTASGKTVGDIILDGDMTLTTGSTLVKSTSIIAVGSSFGRDIVAEATVNITQDMTLKTGSTFITDITTIAAGSSLGVDALNLGAETLTQDMTLAAGSVIIALSTLAAGSSVGADIIDRNGVTLTQDMILETGSTIGSGSDFTTGSSIGASFACTGLTLGSDMTLLAGSMIDNAANTAIQFGSTIGGDGVIGTAALTLIDQMSIKAGSTIAGASVLENGSTLGGVVLLTNDETVSSTTGDGMELGAGTTLADGSLIKAGTYLSNNINTTDGALTAGTKLVDDVTTSGANTLTNEMVLQGGSVIAAGSQLAVNANDSSAAVSQMGETTMSRLSDLDVTSQEGAQTAIAIAEAALKNLGSIRAGLGSVQNQLTSTIANIQTTRINVLASESNIRDVDFADEAANFTKLQILSQAGTFALSQANSSAQGVLSLLQ